jgi:hypothetical protein
MVFGAFATTAHAEPRMELAGYVGWTSAKTRTYDCARPLITGAESCAGSYSEPHYREPGIAVGGSLRYVLHRGILIVADLSYTQKGINGGPNGTHRTYHYIEAPLLAQVDAGRASSSAARAFAFAGLAPAVRVGCTMNGPVSLDGSANAVDYYGSCEDLPFKVSVPKVFDLGLVLGLGVGWEFPFATFDVQMRATQGLIDTQDDGGKTINRVFSILVGVGRGI